jgi:hypothetical protein
VGFARLAGLEELAANSKMESHQSIHREGGGLMTEQR